MSIEEIRQEISRRMDELWDSLPDACKVFEGEFTEREAGTLGKYTALEGILKFIDGQQKSGNVKERVIAAAYKVKPEHVCSKGGVRKVGTQERDDIYQCRIGRHHAEILHCFGKEVDHETDGFYTSFGRWVDRKEAARIALECGQVEKLHFWDDMLDSSDLFDFMDYEKKLKNDDRGRQESEN